MLCICPVFIAITSIFKFPGNKEKSPIRSSILCLVISSLNLNFVFTVFPLSMRIAFFKSAPLISPALKSQLISLLKPKVLA